MRTAEKKPTVAKPDRSRRVPPLLLWFGVAGGPAAWGVHLATSWSVAELACLAPGPAGVLTHGGSLAGGARLAVWLGVVVPGLITLAAVASCAFCTLRGRRLRELPEADDLALERVSLLLVLGWFLSLMSLAAIVGGAVALSVLEPCG